MSVHEGRLYLKFSGEFKSRGDSDDTVQEASEVNSEADPRSVSSVIYEEEWSKLCEDSDQLEDTRERALMGGLRACRLRSVSWLLLLGALSPSGNGSNGGPWTSQLTAARQHYAHLKTRLKKAATFSYSSSPNDDNPLSQNEKSTWNQYFCDRELQSVIRQDVIRTFPGVDFFRDPKIQEAMVNVLFCYARENPTMCYRQGMHEVLAPLLFVLHCDHEGLLHTQELLAQVSSEICVLLDPRFLEEDSYTMFKKVMEPISSWYLITDIAPTSTGYFPPRITNSRPSRENQVISQLNWIKEMLLAPNDPQLYQHLEQLDIPLPLFGIRWLRLLFGREFPLQDLLVLWDAIFADSSNFELVNYIVVAMLVAIRSNLLSSDYTSCLNLLMRYPGSVDISYVIEYALYLKNPARYNCPTMKALMPQMSIGIRRNEKMFQDQRMSSTLPNNVRKKSVSQTTTKSGRAGIVFRSKHQEENRRSVMPLLTATPQTQNMVVDGYALDDPVLLLTELRHSYALMSLCRLKLEQYYRMLEHSVPQSDIHAQEALTGIHELCSLMEVRSGTSMVEPATEAGESNSPHSKNLKRTTTSSSTPSRVNNHSSIDMKVFKQSFIPILDGPVALPPYNHFY